MYPSCNAVYFECGGSGKQNDVGSLPAGFKVLGLVTPDPNGVPDLVGMGDGGMVPLVFISLSKGFPDLPLY
ncbi:hypothetical protein I79_018990 [Cricetulus griseus]|uniref:Uncharacterized protein n=1 Tax=Cricetulus griseus TaxID=10029 RepID=G3I678_CRIGR|nr:hypothetical protein I79_018990 [Cricetulus griseus]